MFFGQGLEGKTIKSFSFVKWQSTYKRFRKRRRCNITGSGLKNCLYICFHIVCDFVFFLCFCTLLQNFLWKNRLRLTCEGFEHVWIASPTLYYFLNTIQACLTGGEVVTGSKLAKNNSPSGLPDQWGFRQKIGASEPFATQSETRLPLPIPPTGLMLSNKRWINGNHS